MDIKRESWGTMPSGEAVELFTLANKRGMQATISNYGATLVGLTAPDKNGSMADVVLGYDTLDEYISGDAYFGAMIGRVANRVGGARFELDGMAYELDRNHGKHQLHGGTHGFSTRLWNAEIVDGAEGQSLVLTYFSKDGEQGYPGNLDVTVVYALGVQGLRFECRAETDKPTVVSLTNHAYFNLGGRNTEDVLDHVVTINSSRYLPTDNDQIPTGAIEDVAGTPLDFTRPTVIGLRIDAGHEAVVIGKGYDQYYIIDGDAGAMNPALQIFHGTSGRVLDVHTTQPGVQFYSGNHLADRTNGKLGAVYGFRSGFCVETQGYVDAPNRPEFPSIVLRPGEKYEHVTEYRFSSM